MEDEAVVSVLLRCAQKTPTTCGGGLQLSENQLNTKLAQLVGEFEDTDFPPLFACVPHELAELVLQKKLPFDQMILYNTFVHISHKHPGPQRGVVLYDEGERIAKGQK